MKNRYLALSVFLLPIVSFSQIFTIGDSTTLTLGRRTSFSTGGNALFSGAFAIGDSSAIINGDADFTGLLTTNGTITGGGDLNFYNNQNVGSLRFVGDGDQVLMGDTLYVENMEVDKTGAVRVETDQVFVSGNLNVIEGVIQTNDIDDLIVTGQSSVDGNGFVEGTLVGLSTGEPVSFPMGINGFKNSITFSETSPGVRLVVDCIVPVAENLIPTDEMVGIADEVEWQVRTIDGSTEATATADFSGLDFLTFSNGEPIRANAYAPAIVIIQKEDTIYSLLNSTDATPENAASSETSGRIVSNTTIVLDTTITRLNAAWIPIVDGPEFFVPNAFSPSGVYEENRVFRPFFVGAEITSISIAVFNNYNDQIYTYSESGNDLELESVGWDGRLQGGQDAEAGVYYYRIQLVADGQVYSKTSSVLLTK